MASPAHVTLHTLSGKWTMNKRLSDTIEPVLVMQGIPWLLRRAAGLASLTLDITQTTDSTGHVHIAVKKIITGGLSVAPEANTLNWEWSSNVEPMLGEIQTRSGWIAYEKLEAQVHADREWGAEQGYLLGGLLDEGEELIRQEVDCKKGGWHLREVWGFEMIEDVRRHVRRAIIAKKSVAICTRIIYDHVLK